MACGMGWMLPLALVLVGVPARADLVRDMVDEVSAEQYRTFQRTIENMGLGFYGGPGYDQGYRNRDGWAGGGTLGNREACLYLGDRLSALGLEVSVQGLYRNVVAQWPGVATPEEIYIVCAHYDTTPAGERPGGDDNASGTAGLLEAARVLTRYRFQSTLRFIAFNAEEEWMRGSLEYVLALPADANIAGVINLDMILRPAWDTHALEPADLDVETLEAPHCTAWLEVFEKASATYVPALVIDANSHYPLRWDVGDHGPFLWAGYPAFVAIENTAAEIWYRGSNSYYHSSEDASDALANDANSPSGVTYDYDFATRVVQATVATLALRAVPVAPVDPNTPGPAMPPPGAPGP
jgi:hypothetical protein